LRKIFENLRKFWTDECKTEKNGINFRYLSQFNKVLLVSHDSMSFLTHVSAQNFQSEHFDCVKETRPRYSVPISGVLICDF
jgi:hypothetical protein